MRSLPCSCLLLVCLLAPTAALAGPDDPAAAGGRLYTISADDLDLIGELWAEMPLWSRQRPEVRNQQVFLSVFTRTAIEQVRSDALRVRDLDYRFGLGWRTEVSWLDGGSLVVQAGQWGKQQVDAEGHGLVRFVGVTVDAERETGPISGRIMLGPVLDDNAGEPGGVEGDAVVEGRMQWRPWNARRGMRFSLDVELAGLIGGDDAGIDLRAGPSVEFPLGPGRSTTFFLHYLWGGNPLGIDRDAVLFGFDYSEKPGVHGEGGPDIDGIFAAGAGDGRVSGQLRVRFLSPTFARHWRGMALIDANALGAGEGDEGSELYYFYHLGLERTLGPGRIGGYFYHRSNHLLDTFNERVTSLNVAEAGFESPHWEVPARGPVGARLDYRARLGYVIESDFGDDGDDERWHLRGGLRWSMPLWTRRLSPYLIGEIERGDVERDLAGIGIRPLDGLELQLEYRQDEQYFGDDQTAVLLTARYSL